MTGISAPPTIAMHRMPEPWPGVLAQAVDREGEDRREHDRVEEPDRDDRPHRDLAGGEHGDQHQRGRAERVNASSLPGLITRSVKVPMKRPIIAPPQ